jgi:hypothetical protein
VEEKAKRLVFSALFSAKPRPILVLMCGHSLKSIFMKYFFARLFGQMTFFQRFTLVSFAIMLTGMLVIGWWVGEQIKTGVVNETAATAALYMNSFIAPNIQELSSSDTLTPEHIATLDNLLKGTDLGHNIVGLQGLGWKRSHPFQQ